MVSPVNERVISSLVRTCETLIDDYDKCAGTPECADCQFARETIDEIRAAIDAVRNMGWCKVSRHPLALVPKVGYVAPVIDNDPSLSSAT